MSKIVHGKLSFKVGHSFILFTKIVGNDNTLSKTRNLIPFVTLVYSLLLHLRFNKFLTASLYLLTEY